MKIPEGFEEVVGSDNTFNVLKVDGAMYRLVQAACQWWYTFCQKKKEKDYECS